MRTLRILAVVTCVPAALWAAAPSPLPLATVEDSIAMVRIQYQAGSDGSVGAFSPDGRKFVAAVWRGDLERNVNVHSLLVFDLSGGERPAAPKTVLTRDFPHDPDDQDPSPFKQLTFLADNRTIAFLGREGLAPAQVYTADTETGTVWQLTRHSTAVRSFIVGRDGQLRAFSAVAHEDEDGGKSRAARLDEDGVFLWDQTLFGSTPKYLRYSPAMRSWTQYIRQYFVLAESGPRVFFDSRQSLAAADPNDNRGFSPDQDVTHTYWGSLTADPDANRALFFPFALTEHPMRPERYAHYAQASNAERRLAAPYGVVGLATGRVDRLLDAPRAQFDRGIAGNPLWAADGKWVIIYSLLPIAAGDTVAARQVAQWLEVELATRRYSPVPVPSEWDVVRWDASGGALVLRKGDAFGLLHRGPDRSWGKFTELGAPAGLSGTWQVASNGRHVVGVKEGLLIPPELVVFDLMTKKTTTLTQLNPQLHQRRYGAVEELTWSHKYEDKTRGYLIRPVDYRRGVRYPLVVLLDDNVLSRVEDPYLLDGTRQLQGHAIQMLAAQGFMVLYARTPRWPRGTVGTPKEREYMCAQIEAAIAALDNAGLIDSSRVGVSGWSRAAYHTDSLLIHSSHRFAAATQIDGGAVEYAEGNRPFTDEELKRIRTPLLFQPHGLPTMVTHAAMADRLESFGTPTEILYFATASHSTTRPQHRLRSLGTHLDWWRFWLKDEEDNSPAKAAQYARWRELREMQLTARSEGMAQPIRVNEVYGLDGIQH